MKNIYKLLIILLILIGCSVKPKITILEQDNKELLYYTKQFCKELNLNYNKIRWQASDEIGSNSLKSQNLHKTRH